MPLIDRSLRPWKVTQEGKAFYEGSRSVVEKYYELETEIKGLHNTVTSSLNVACIYSVGLRHMNRFVKKFSTIFPQVRINLEYLHPDQIYERIQKDTIDIGVVSFPRSDRNITVIPWHSELMVIVTCNRHRFVRKKKITLPEIEGEKFIGFDKGLIIRKEVDRFLRSHAVDPKVIMEFDNIESIKRAVEVGTGISILPLPTLENEIKTGMLHPINMMAEEFRRPLALIHRRGKIINNNILEFIKYLIRE